MIVAAEFVKNLMNYSNIITDNLVFRLHYRVTAILLVFCSLMVSARMMFGNPIECLAGSGVEPRVLNTYCWVHSTFSVTGPRASIGRLGRDHAVPGVMPYVPDEDQIGTHKYYQWVAIILMFQALCFYLPRYIWQVCEARHIKMLVVGLNSPVVNEALHTNQKTLLVDYFEEHLNGHTLYMVQYILCEILNALNVIGQVYLLILFLGHDFIEYGLDAVGYSNMDTEMRVDPMARMFPTLAKCFFNKYGPSGTIQVFDGLCVMPLNIFNEKIFVFLWFWFVFVAYASVANLIYRIAVVTCPYMRIWILCAKTNLQVSREDIRNVCNKLGVGDWFVLNLVAKNVSNRLLEEIIIDLSRSMDTKDSPILLSVLKNE